MRAELEPFGLLFDVPENARVVFETR